MSRYIGVGTYDPEEMKRGTIQTCAIDAARPKAGIYWWRDRLCKETDYVFPTEQIGMDIHFAKHYQCGIELRTFDGFPLESLRPVLERLVLICAYAQQVPFRPEDIASRSQSWNDVVFKSILYGNEALVEPFEQMEYFRVLGIPQVVEERQNKDWDTFSQELFRAMFKHLNKKGTHILTKMASAHNIESSIDILDSFNSTQNVYHHQTWVEPV
jgi:hypothetical protein